MSIIGTSRVNADQHRCFKTFWRIDYWGCDVCRSEILEKEDIGSTKRVGMSKFAFTERTCPRHEDACPLTRMRHLRGGAGKSLSRLTDVLGRNRWCWKESLFMCRIASLFLLQMLKRSMSSDARDFNIEKRTVIFFPARQVAEGNLRHSERNVSRTCTIVCQSKNLGGPVQTWWFFHQWCASSWTTQNIDHFGDYWSHSQANGFRLNQ
jgi:hypothetical protein